MGYRSNRLDEPIFMAVPKPMLTELGIHHRLESCGKKVQRQVGNRKTRLSKEILVDKKIQQSKNIYQQVVKNDHSIRSFDKIYSLEIFRILP